MSLRSLAPICAFALAGCGSATTEPAADPQAEIPERCRTVHLDKLADNDWILVRGTAGADPKVRMRFLKGGPDGADYEVWYVGGMFTKVRMRGEKRDKDVQFTEVPNAARAELAKKGEVDLARAYVVPKVEKCALEVLVGTVDGKGKERIPPKGVEMVVFPDKEGVEFTYRPPARTLFLGKAARTRAVADKELAEAGGPNPEHEYGDVPVGVFTRADEDGPADCTYDMDLYFDDRNLPEQAGLAAGPVADGWRHWFHEWKAPYSGNHHFEMYRYRTCGGSRELIDVAAIEAVLQ